MAFVFALTAFGAPALAMTFQPAPRDAAGRSNMVDPEERSEALTERMRRSDERTFAVPALSGRSLVMPSGAAANPALASPFSPFSR